MPDQPKDPADPKSFLLPKKESGPSPLSAQRINAGALLAQEVNAELPKSESKPPLENGLVEAKPTRGPFPEEVSTQKTLNPDAQAVGVPTKASGKEDTMVHAVQTYSTDISQVVRSGGVSNVTIAAAEAERRAKDATKGEPVSPSLLNQEERTSRWRIALIIGGVVMILAALGLVATLLLRVAPKTPSAAATAAPFMSVDQTIPVVVDANTTRDALVTQLEAAREQVNLSVGLVAQLYVGTATTTGTLLVMLPAQQLLATLSPDIPQDLLLTVTPTYLLGVHSFDENQSFLVLRVDSYQQAYSGLLAWEPNMQQELSPLFTRHPALHIPNQAGTATSTPTTTDQFIKTGFVDQVVENHDARVILNSAGDILLLWTFLDRNTVVITTNEYTLREVIRRVNTASLVPQP